MKKCEEAFTNEKIVVISDIYYVYNRIILAYLLESARKLITKLLKISIV